MNTFEKIQSLIQSCKSEKIQLAFQIANNNNISEDEILNPWKELIAFFLKEHLIRAEMNNIKRLSTILEFRGVCFYTDHIISLPEKIGNLKNLTYFEIQQNELKELPKSFTSLTNLKEVFLWDNQIEKLPEDIGKLTNLKKLTLSYNKINTLPESIKLLQNLENLVLYENPIDQTELYKLRKTLPNCTLDF